MTTTNKLPLTVINAPEITRDPVMTLEPGAPEWAQSIPTSINDTYGDPFIPEQVDNTIAKLQELRFHRAPLAIFTKAGPDPEVLRKLETVSHLQQIVVYYSLTALDEGGISFDDRVRMIKELRALFPNTLVFTRPIIRGQNDDPATLRRFVEVAAEHTGYLVLGGLHDPYKKKRIQIPVEDQLVAYCDEARVRSFHKTSCAAAHLHGTECWVHDLGAPRNLEVVAELGYEFAVSDNQIVLAEGTTGDINFLRMLTRAEIFIENLKSNYNLLTIPTGERKLEATSSWFAWSENIEVCLDCSYCIIKQIEYLKKMRVQIGVHPTRLPEIVVGAGRRIDLDQFRKTKLRAQDPAEKRHRYEDVRIAKPCFSHRYPAAPAPFEVRA
ncbi:hypothetical protein [Streptomyces sp. MUM 178J]|uniref:hypothetical protein n=1 Tax=Streptomyces sp. MUM 178J TaxID=2791991 RepID=UPI001F048840|nr:hypothetical protein [Streptomyces sp. MUM 178J]WRQ80749.1 hypothetical protein I3F59_016055 [Streptomyces sp. MUM 178J]